MADFHLYLKSLSSLSDALDKMVIIKGIQYKINKEYDNLPLIPNSDTKFILESFFDAYPQIKALKQEEKVIRIQTSESISCSINNALSFIVTFEKQDISDDSLTGFQEHLQLLHEVITELDFVNDSDIIVNDEVFNKAIAHIENYKEFEIIRIIRDKLSQIRQDLELKNVGKK